MISALPEHMAAHDPDYTYDMLHLRATTHTTVIYTIKWVVQCYEVTLMKNKIIVNYEKSSG